ncbi:hypothetical protein KI387_008136, partial [Taxus chinensis]
DININSMSLEIGNTGKAKVYIYLKPKMENGKYFENEFNLLEFTKVKNIVGTLHDEETTFPHGDDDEEEENEELKEDSGGL